MVEKAQVESLSLNLPTDPESLLLVENALNWIEENTSVNVNRNDLSANPATVQLFMVKYVGVMQLPDGVTSESAGGLSQSFANTDKTDLLLKIASSIFGENTVTGGKVRFVSANSVWA